MFVPFIFNLEVTGDYDHLIILYKYLALSQSNGWPAISHERYFQSLADVERLGLGDVWFREMKEKYGAEKPTDAMLASPLNFQVPQKLEDEIIAEFPSRLDAWIYLLQNRHEKWECFLEGMIDAIQEKCGEPIEAFLCFYSTESLRHIAKKRGISVIHCENGPLRPPLYRQTAYLDRGILPGPGNAEERFRAFQKETEETPVPILSRKEILKLLLREEWQSDLDRVDEEPSFEVCLLLQSYQIGMMMQYTHMTDSELRLLARRRYADKKILYRGHPGYQSGIVPNTDHSPTSFHCICRCSRVAGVMSGMLLETMLAGRIACCYGESPFAFMCNKGIDDPNTEIAPLDFVNFAVFGYLVPWEWLTDAEYLRWRLSGPPEVDIYQKHFEYYAGGRD